MAENNNRSAQFDISKLKMFTVTVNEACLKFKTTSKKRNK